MYCQQPHIHLTGVGLLKGPFKLWLSGHFRAEDGLQHARKSAPGKHAWNLQVGAMQTDRRECFWFEASVFLDRDLFGTFV
jgi:hypothetical protein